MAHEHAHARAGLHHHHEHRITSLNRAFLVGIVLNVGFVVVEFAVGLFYGSMGLLSDAGHNLSDVAGLLLAMLAFRLAQAHATPRYTYGYKKSTVLISLLNSVILLIAVGVIVAESIGRMLHPEPIAGGAIAWTAGVGVVVNGFTAWLFMKDKERDLNVKGAYLHMAADALVSIGVLVSGVVISWTGWTVVDPVVGLAVAGVNRRRARGGGDDLRGGGPGGASYPYLGDEHHRERPHGACRAGGPRPAGGGETAAQGAARRGGHSPCDARIRVGGGPLLRSVRLK